MKQNVKQQTDSRVIRKVPKTGDEIRSQSLSLDSCNQTMKRNVKQQTDSRVIRKVPKNGDEIRSQFENSRQVERTDDYLDLSSKGSFMYCFSLYAA